MRKPSGWRAFVEVAGARFVFATTARVSARPVGTPTREPALRLPRERNTAVGCRQQCCFAWKAALRRATSRRCHSRPPGSPSARVAGHGLDLPRRGGLPERRGRHPGHAGGRLTRGRCRWRSRELRPAGVGKAVVADPGREDLLEAGELARGRGPGAVEAAGDGVADRLELALVDAAPEGAPGDDPRGGVKGEGPGAVARRVAVEDAVPGVVAAGDLGRPGR